MYIDLHTIGNLDEGNGIFRGCVYLDENDKLHFSRD